MNDKHDLQKAVRGTLNTFLSHFPLYKKLEVYTIYAELDQKPIIFEAFCKEDNRNTSYKIEDTDKQSLRNSLVVCAMYLARNSSMPHEFAIHCSAVCQMCGTNKMQFLIIGKSSRDKDGELKLHIQKAGQYPAPSLIPDKELKEFMTEEDIDFYKKGKLNLEWNYGIGAYAYFRRILENEILNIANRLIETNEEAKPLISAAVDQYFKLHQTSNLIRALSKYLPKSLLINNENPILELHSKLSEGIHSLSEDECTNLSMEIETVLRHVIIEMREKETKDYATSAFNKLKGKSNSSNNG